MAEGKELIEQLNKLGFREPRPWREFFAVFKPPKQWARPEIEEVSQGILLKCQWREKLPPSFMIAFFVFSPF